MAKLSRTYIFRHGGWGACDDEPWYDEAEITVHEGDECPVCGKGVMKVSRNNRLYCSEICWKENEDE